MSLFISIIYYTMYIPELTKIIYYINIYIWRKIYFSWRFLWYLIKEKVKPPKTDTCPLVWLPPKSSSPAERLRGRRVVPHPAAHAATAAWLQDDDGETEQTDIFQLADELFSATSPWAPARGGWS